MNIFSKQFKGYQSIIIFDCETNGLDYRTCQIIEFAAIKIDLVQDEKNQKEKEMDYFCFLPEGKILPKKIVELTGITDKILKEEGISQEQLAKEIVNLVDESTIFIAHNAQFDILFLLELLKGYQVPKFDCLDSLTVYKDRRAYPHKLANAITEYGLEDKVVNSHRAIDDVLALLEVVKKMIEERNDLYLYLNIFGYNPKYGVSGRKIPVIQYFAQKFNQTMTNENNTLPALTKKEEAVYTQMSFDL